MTSGLTTTTATSALIRETPTKETTETAEIHVEKHLKILWVRIGETLKRLRSTNAGRRWIVWVSGGRKRMLGSSKVVNAACLAIFGPALTSLYLGDQNPSKNPHLGLYGPGCMMVYLYARGFLFHRCAASSRVSKPVFDTEPVLRYPDLCTYARN